MGFTSGLLFLLCFSAIAFLAAFKRNYFSPGALYIICISGSMAIAFLPVDPAMTPFRGFTWLVIGSSSFAFVTGTIVARLHLHATGIRVERDQPFQDQVKIAVSGYNWKRHIFLTTLGASSFIPAAIAVLQKHGTITILNPHVATLMKIGGLDIGYWQFPLVLYSIWLMLLYPALFRKMNPHPWLRWYSRILFVILLVSGFAFFPARNPVMQMLLFCAVFTNAVIFRLKIRHIVLGILFFFVLFVAASSAKQQVAKFDLLAKDVWRYPYIYIANNYWNLDYALNPMTNQKEHPTTYGHHLIGGMFLIDLWPDWPAIGKAFQFDTMMNESVQKIQGLNTLGYWWGLYKDFWMFGIVLLPFLGGLLQGWFYNRIRLWPDLQHLLIYSYVTVYIILAFFADFWGLILTPLTLFPMWLISTVSTQKPVH